MSHIKKKKRIGLRLSLGTPRSHWGALGSALLEVTSEQPLLQAAPPL